MTLYGYEQLQSSMEIVRGEENYAQTLGRLQAAIDSLSDVLVNNLGEGKQDTLRSITNMAGDVVGTMMPYYFASVLAASALAAVLLAALRRTLAVRLPTICLALALAALGVQAYVQWHLYLRILAVKQQVATFEAEPDAPARREFGRLHGTSMALNLLTLADGAILLALVSPRRR
jgi:uncharacterized membrane protein YebE (DUF533 family)